MDENNNINKTKNNDLVMNDVHGTQQNKSRVH